MAVCESTPDSLCDAVTNSEAISFGDAFDGDINIPSSRRRLGFCKEGDDDHHDGQSWQRGDHHGDPHDDPHQAHDCNTFWDGSTIKTRAGAASPLDRPWLSRASSAVSGSVRVQTTGKAFGSWSLFHSFYNLNDGLYGNSKSWCPLIYSGHPSDKAGVVLPAPQTIVGIQFARDLTGEVKDGAGGVVTVEYSATANSDANPGAWASSNGWVLVGRLTGWAANTRNYYEFNTPVVADGLRVTVDTNADGQLTCIDELEIYSRSPGPPSPPPPGPSPPPPPVVVVSPSPSPPVVVVSPSPPPKVFKVRMKMIDRVEFLIDHVEYDLIDHVEFHLSGETPNVKTYGAGIYPYYNSADFDLNPGEWLVAVDRREMLAYGLGLAYGVDAQVLVAVRFETNTGRKSQWYGDPGASSTPGRLAAPLGQMIVGLVMRSRPAGCCQGILDIVSIESP